MESSCRCPSCGAQLMVSVAPTVRRGVLKGPWNIKEYVDNEATLGPPAQGRRAVPWAGGAEAEPAPPIAFKEATRRTPFRAPALESDVWVPMMLALLTGVVFAVLTGAVSVFWDKLPWYSFVGGFGGGFAGAWIVFVVQTQKLLWMVETVTGQDLDGDGDVGEPERLLVEINEGGTTRYWDAPKQNAIEFARGVLAGRSMSEEDWKREFGGIAQFKAFRGELLTHGLVQWRNPNARAQGLVLTHEGRTVFQDLANLSPTAGG